MTIDHLITLAQNCYAQARATADPVAKHTLVEIGDMHLNEAEKRKRARVLKTSAATFEPQVI